MKTVIAIIALIIIIVAAVFIMKKPSQTGVDTQTEPYGNMDSAAMDTQPSAPLINQPQTSMQEPTQKTVTVEMTTSLGVISLELDPSHAPKTVANFVKLANEGYYDGTRFHRVIEGFMIQGGDPQSKDTSLRARWGTGGPGYKFDDELTGNEKYPQGTLAMANAGPNTNGSQFFIVTASPSVALPPSYTVFGKVISGMDVALKIEKVDTAPNDQPVEDVVVTSVKVIE